ncbi:MAG TPA: pyruvate kinase alpha/beta domain-containing protein [bacterium]|nr:MAG: Pyruvate kinase, alpha/beta domain [bacterium ADurb.Bin236]HOY64033.1 pyruvate kinase alpha/beta domain-containing protein [bacterium]HPI76143.1 pyruvate kinase alpha/beta domain-containing protein [bacterium]HPN94633.1 pyruvate kinase alpha/beta domain-containing protein [bacterium]
MYFKEPGPKNTDATLDIALKEAMARKINHIVVASTSGETGVKAARKFQDCPARVVVVTHNTGFSQEGVNECSEENAELIRRMGGRVHTGTHILRGLGNAIRQRSGNYSEEQIVANTLRILGEGVKVCVEICAMACDSGLIDFEDVIAIAGTGRGADTCAVVAANSSNKFFDIRVREILAKPSGF